MKRTPKDPKEIYAGQDADAFGKAQRGLVKMKESRRGHGDQSEAHKGVQGDWIAFRPIAVAMRWLRCSHKKGSAA